MAPKKLVEEKAATPGPLAKYRAKRDRGSTNEPFDLGDERNAGAPETWQSRFVVHQHDATRMHYDLRLEIGPILHSFAIPKGLTLDPSEKHLAMHTEEHPLSYLDFEEVIPEGNYGAGAMIVWDQGRVTFLEKSAQKGLEDGKLDFVLSGHKVEGRFALIATGRRKVQSKAYGRASESEWLLVKKPDAFAKPGYSLIANLPRSVRSGLLVEELPKKDALEKELIERCKAKGSSEKSAEAEVFRPPMIAGVFDVPLGSDDFLYELKLDGARLLATKKGSNVDLRYRSGRRATGSYPEVRRALESYFGDSFVLDGEVVAFDEKGQPSFSKLLSRITATKPSDVERAKGAVQVAFLAFDLLEFSGQDLRQLPLEVRKELLQELVRGQGIVRALDHLIGKGDALFSFCEKMGLEGIVAKRRLSRYRHGPERTTDWAKVKRARDDDFVVVGFSSAQGKRGELGSLALATYVREKLVYRGKVGSGFRDELIRLVAKELAGLAKVEKPEGFAGVDPKTVWVRPDLVARVRHQGFTDEGSLRAPVFEGLRYDVRPGDCTAAPLEEPSEPPEKGSEENEELESELALPRKPAGSGVPAETRTRARLTNLEKVFWPEEGYTKRDLLAYYARIAPVLLRFLKGRPVVLVRYPDGIDGKNFYQWRAPEGTPSWIRTSELYDEEKREERGEGKSTFLLDNEDSLLHVINLGCIPLHVLASRETTPTSCDFLTIDFDLGTRTLADGVRLALGLAELLTELGLSGYPKTSGQRGLHVLVPLGPNVPFESAKLLCELLGRLLVGRFPEVSTMERRKERRGDKVYVDTGQTGRSRTIVSPYSVRAFAGATVSTPLRFSELHLALDPRLFNIESVPERIEREGDLLLSFLDERPNLANVLNVIASWTTATR